EESTPTPTPTVFKAQSEERVPWPRTEEDDGESTPRASTSRAVSLPRTVSAQLVRKKTGEPLKSSLKGRREVVRGDLSVVTGGAPAGSKSEPNTPTHIKSVHFDAKLEHVKLFLAEQKPLAVSRDGSATEDTSGTESDFPAFIYGPDESQARGKLSMRVVNMPVRVRKDGDVVLEELTLSQDGTAAHGRVRVRNIAFEKWVAVRFTFDWWQTTSEVTAKYFESLESGEFDRFTFTIRLNDMLARIEEKTLFLALRYRVVGQEMWDNNDGSNYQVKFCRARPQLLPPVEKADAAGIADLKSKLEKVAVGREKVGGYTSKQSDKTRDDFDLRSKTPLSARYDFSASLKTPWKSSLPVSHSRVSTYPNVSAGLPQRPFSSPATKTSFAEDAALVSRGSPHVFDGDDIRPSTFYSGSDLDDALEDTPLPALSRRRGRNHQRGFFDAGSPQSAAIKKTPPGAPFIESSLRYNSLDSYHLPTPPGPRGETLSPSWHIERGGSEESTPSVTSTSESSRSSSPSGSPIDPVMFNFTGPGSRSSPSPSDVTDYNVFLNKFCFYTGSDSLLDVQPDEIQRSHSASSVEEFLSSSPVLGYYLSPGQTPTRSSSFDDVVSMSGTATPTARCKVESECPTPVPFAH
ncbi:putative phosphatase regulatory subunit-domain-containing protein, partial [Sparassis latifolia]